MFHTVGTSWFSLQVARNRRRGSRTAGIQTVNTSRSLQSLFLIDGDTTATCWYSELFPSATRPRSLLVLQYWLDAPRPLNLII